MTPVPIDALRRLEPTAATFEEALTHGDEVIPVGPFRAIINPRIADLWASQALPVDALGSREDTLRHIDTLRRVFAERGRTAVVELNEPVWPELPGLLREAGFVELDREPIMVCTPDSFRPYASPEVTVRFLQPDESETDLVAYQTIFSRVLLGKPYERAADGLAPFRQAIRHVGGRGYVLAELAGAPAGTGFLVSSQGVGEITQVATIPAMRRRGVAATLTTFLMREGFGRGDELIWLTAEAQPGQTLYRKLGFHVAGERLYFQAG